METSTNQKSINAERERERERENNIKCPPTQIPRTRRIQSDGPNLVMCFVRPCAPF